MMYKWLPEDIEPNLPPASHTNLGVGAMVFNDKDQILAISEKHYEYPHWKLPGGYVERGKMVFDLLLKYNYEILDNDTEYYIILPSLTLSKHGIKNKRFFCF